MLVANPTLPRSISAMMMRRRAGWATTASDSVVVNPTPVSADRAWKRADGRDIPVAVRAMVAIRVRSSDSMATTRSRMTPYTKLFYQTAQGSPQRRCQRLGSECGASRPQLDEAGRPATRPQRLAFSPRGRRPIAHRYVDGHTILSNYAML